MDLDAVLIALFTLVNIIIVIVYYKRDLGVFQAPFLVACMSITLLLPQLTTIYYHPYYDNSLLYKLCYMMITCNIAFVLAFDRARKKKIPEKVREMDLTKVQYLVLLFGLLGFSTVFIYGGSLEETVDSVAASNLKMFSLFGLSLALISFHRGHNTIIVYTGFLLSLAAMINFAFFVKASRTDSLILFIFIFLFLSLRFPKRKKLFRTIVFCFLIFGSILSASISGIRKNVRGSEDSEAPLTELSFWETFQESFTNSYTDVGMDSGNAALGIEYAYQNGTYDYGLQVWNGFVFCYVPKRFFGEEFKESLYYDTGYLDEVSSLTNNVTTMTGYFYAFTAFSFFGFIFFGIMGYMYGLMWNRSTVSDLYKFFYLTVLGIVPIMITHGFQLVFVNIEFALFFVYPFISLFVRKKRVIPLNG
jgi:hypothetical protein